MAQDKPLQQALIKSLETLSDESPYREKLQAIINDLKKSDVIIPKNDYENVIKFVLRLIKYMPGVLDNKRKDESLKDLCLHCLRQMNLLNELKSNSFKNR